MIVERLWPGNAYRNFHYLIACAGPARRWRSTRSTAALCARVARERGFTITQILNTHEHLDHTGGNEGLRAVTGAKVLAHAGAAGRNRRRRPGPRARRRDPRRAQHRARMSRHARAHDGARLPVRAAPEPALFCGDTLFNAGAGNCHNGGRPSALYETFVEQLAKLPAATKIYPGHEYLGRNLAFTLDREPGNRDAAAMAADTATLDAAATPVTTLADELRVNTFFRLGSAGVIAGCASGSRTCRRRRTRGPCS